MWIICQSSWWGKFVSLVSANKGEDVQNAAIGLDVRSGRYLEGLEEVLDQLKAEGYKFEILFLDADDRTLVKRYKETRRTHPLAMTGRVDEGIQKERECLSFLKEHADYIIDTTHLLTRELKKELDKIFVENGKFDNMMISVLSFGFKYGSRRMRILCLMCDSFPILIMWMSCVL